MTIDCWIAAVVETSSTRPQKASRLVQQAEALALASVDDPLTVSALCHIIGVNERTLRKAFRRVHGIPPCRRLRMLRLANARRALLSANGTLTKVTEIAMSFGFAELGRFSVEYKKAFGESPSQTLCRAPRPALPSATSVRSAFMVIAAARRKGEQHAMLCSLPSRQLRQPLSLFYTPLPESEVEAGSF